MTWLQNQNISDKKQKKQKKGGKTTPKRHESTSQRSRKSSQATPKRRSTRRKSPRSLGWDRSGSQTGKQNGTPRCLARFFWGKKYTIASTFQVQFISIRLFCWLTPSCGHSSDWKIRLQFALLSKSWPTRHFYTTLTVQNIRRTHYQNHKQSTATKRKKHHVLEKLLLPFGYGVLEILPQNRGISWPKASRESGTRKSMFSCKQWGKSKTIRERSALRRSPVVAAFNSSWKTIEKCQLNQKTTASWLSTHSRPSPWPRRLLLPGTAIEVKISTFAQPVRLKWIAKRKQI